MQQTPDHIIDFWFSARTRPLWFKSTPEFDQELMARFEGLYQQARQGGLDTWEETPIGALALVIILDQFPLNMYRDQASSFSAEGMAREVARRLLDRDGDQGLTDEQKAFLYLPFMHSERLEDQDRSVELYEATGLEDNLRFARHHREIVRRFGRFPHRNAILGRESSPEELAYLASGKAFTG